MTPKRVWAVFFSPTGTTRRVVTAAADRLAKQTGAARETYDFTLPSARQSALRFSPEDLVVFGMPVYAGRVPNVLLPYLDTPEGAGALAIPVVLFGNRDFDDALMELRDILVHRGFRVFAAAAFVGEHSFSRTLAAGRPDTADLEVVCRFADEATKKLALLPTSGSITPLAVTGTPHPYRGYYRPRDREGNFIDIRKVTSKVSEACTGCGTCARLCSMGSIPPENVREYQGICIKCGACIKGCPVQARYYDDDGYLYHRQELEEGLTRRGEPSLFL